MHTSSTPGAGTDGVVNPNPVAGLVLVQFKNNFNKYLGGFSGFNISSNWFLNWRRRNKSYCTSKSLHSLGTTTAAQWLAAGVPAGLTAAVGMSFIAIKTGAIGGTGTVISAGVSGITSVEVIGDPNVSISNSSIAQNGGAYLLVQLLGATSSSVTTLIPTAPVDGSVIGMSAFFDLSSVTIDGL